MTIEYKQTWWHIEEIFRPKPARRIRQVLDIFTDEPEISFFLGKTNFCCVKIIGRNARNKELAFIDTNVGGRPNLVCNLRPLSDFPLIDDSSGQKLRHVRLEIDYTLINVKTNPRHQTFIQCIRDWVFNTKSIENTFDNPMQPEIYVTLPPGWVIGGSSLFNKLFLGDTREGYQIGMQYRVTRNPVQPGIPPNQDENFPVKFHFPFIKITDGKRTYQYLVNNQSYQEYKNQIRDAVKVTNTIIYHAELSLTMVAISLIPLLFIGISGFALYQNLQCIMKGISLVFTSNFALPYLIVLLSYLYFYFSLAKEGYQVPGKLITIISILCSVGLIMIILVFSTFGVPG